MACAATAAGKDANTGSSTSGLVAAATGGSGGGGGSGSAASASSSSVAGAVGGGGGGSSSAAAVVAGAPQSNGGGVMNRQSRFAMEGVGARVIRGPDWKWGKQVCKVVVDGEIIKIVNLFFFIMF